MKRQYVFLLFIFLFSLTRSGAQQTFFKQSSIGVQGYYGSFLTRSPKALYLKDSYTYFGELYFQQQTDGSKPWHRANGLPQWGAALFFGNIGSRRYMGNMGGAYGFINLPLLQKKLFSSKMRAGLGLGWVQHPYNKETNHKNVLIGSHLNGYISLLWQNEIHLGAKTFINTALGFSHLSNGGSTFPNLGLNIPALSVGLRYGGAAAPAAATQKAATDQQTHFKIFAAAGIKQAPWVGSRRYVVNTFGAEASRHTSSSSEWGGGVLIYYDRSLEVDPAGIPSNKREINKTQAGVFAAYEHHFGKLSVPLQLGAYVFNRDLAPLLFQNLGFRYRFSNKLSGQFLMKTHMGQADHLQLGLGYHLK